MKHQPLLIASRWMPSLIGASLSALALVLLPTLLSAQETAPDTGKQQEQESRDKTDQIRAYGKNVFIIHSRQQFLENATQLLRDLDAGGFVGIVEQFLRPKSAELIDNDAPWFIYENQLLALPIKDGDKLAKLILNKNSATAADLSQPTEIQEMPIDSDGFWFDDDVACIDGKFVLLAEKSEDIKNYQASELLEPELPESSRRLIESSGICWVGQAQLNELLLGMGDWNFEMDRADEAERELLERINQAAGSAQLMLAGATYEQHTLELRQQLLLEENEHVDGLFVFDRPQADLRLGLPAKELVASVAVDFSVLKSRTFPRAIIKQGLRLPFARSGPINPAYELAADLLGDGINEMDTFRVGLYQRSGESGTGNLCLLGIIDPKDKQRFINEIQSLAVVVNTSPAEGQNDSEKTRFIRQWISDLDASSFETRRQATTRLRLAGPAAIEQMEQVLRDGAPPETRMRVQLLLREMKNTSIESARQMIQEPVIKNWFDGSVKFSFIEQDKLVGDLAGYTLEIQTPQEIGESLSGDIAQLRKVFGQDWNRIKLIPVGDRLVWMFGSDSGLLQEVIDNVATNQSPLQEMLGSNTRRDPSENRFEAHLSIPRVFNLFVAEENEHLEPTEDLTSFALRFDRLSWEGLVHLPAAEFKQLIRHYFRF